MYLEVLTTVKANILAEELKMEDMSLRVSQYTTRMINSLQSASNSEQEKSTDSEILRNDDIIGAQPNIYTN